MSTENQEDSIEEIISFAEKLKDNKDEGFKFKLLYQIRDLVNEILKGVKDEEMPKRLLEAYFEEHLEQIHLPADFDLDDLETEEFNVRQTIKQLLTTEDILVESGKILLINKGNNQIFFCRSDLELSYDAIYEGIMQKFPINVAAGPKVAEAFFRICGKEYDFS